MSNQPDLTKFRGAIFWDTAIENIDFKRIVVML